MQKYKENLYLIEKPINFNTIVGKKPLNLTTDLICLDFRFSDDK